MFSQIHFGMRRLWDIAPALILGIELYLGLCFIRTHDPVVLLPALTILFILHIKDLKKRKIKTVVLPLFMFAFGILWGNHFLKDHSSQTLPSKGCATFCPSSISLKKTMFKTSYLYKGTIECFLSDTGEKYFNIPCKIFAPKGLERPVADGSFFIKGTLNKLSIDGADFSADEHWQKIPSSYSLAEKRFQAKKKFKSFLKKHIRNRRAIDFFYSICTGEIENKMLAKDFANLGLQHILAISGFHFGLLAVFISFVFKKILKEKVFLFLLFVTLSIYFLFLGNSPSIFRAWLAISIWIIGKWIHRKTNALNTLGVCLMIELLIIPRSLFQLGFQLSFLCTLALLLIAPVTENWMESIFPSRSKEVLKGFTWYDKFGYKIASYLKKSIGITIAVHIVSIPVCLYFFKSFPLLSLLYNLYVPLLVTLCLGGFLIGCILSFVIPMGSNLFFYPSSRLASYMLEVISFPPYQWHHRIEIKQLPLFLVIVYLILVLLIFAAKFHNKKIKKLSY